MKLFFVFFLSVIVYSCVNSPGTTEPSPDTLQKDLFDTVFNYDDVKSVEIIETEHRMHGVMVKSQKLTAVQQKLFIDRLQQVESAGMYKCFDKYVVRFILENDTLQLKACEEMISAKNSDLYYSLGKGRKIIGDFIPDH